MAFHVTNPTEHENESVSSLQTTAYTASAGYGLLDDVPPTYDDATGTSGSGSAPSPLAPSYSRSDRLTVTDDGRGEGSSSSQVRAPVAPSAPSVLFSGPPNAEPMISRDKVAAGPHIELRKVFGKLETWDPKLRDPEVLYDFIRAQALNPPHIKIRCSGKHYETAQVQTLVNDNGKLRTISQGQQYLVTDFDFTIDLTPVYGHENNLANVHLLARRPHIPSYRGTHQKTFGAAVPPNAYPGKRVVGRVANGTERDLWDEWGKFCKQRGRAPWADMMGDEEFRAVFSGRRGPRINLGSVVDGLNDRIAGRRGPASDEESLLRSQNEGPDAALRQWCEAYCADPGLLKSFVLQKVIWGWDMRNLQTAIERAILSTGYQPSKYGIKVDFKMTDDDRITVRPDNFLVRITRSGIWLFFLWITLIYPMIWLWQRVSPRGGAPYDVATANYAMKFYPPLPSTFPNETLDQARLRLPALFKLHPDVPRNPFLIRGPKGVHYLLGRREGEWFRSWEDVIRMGVRMRYQGELVQTVVDDDEDPPQLDGY